MDSEHDNGADSANLPPAAGAGAQLRAAREALRLDLAHIAAETRIPVRHLEAIEEGNFESLPSRAYAIGFSRTYAKAVGLDAAQITDVVRGELADGSMRRVTSASAMEPGDPARLPSSGLAWAGALAALILAVGAFAFYNSYFAAGTQPGSLLTPAPQATPVAKASPQPTTAPVAGGEVILTALEDNIWLRLYEEGGERLLERTLKQGETVLVPSEAVDPRINTGRPDALAITVGGKPVAKLGDTPATVSGAQVSAAALLGRGSAIPAGSDVAAADRTATTPLSASRRNTTAPRRAAAPAPTASAEPAPEPTTEPAIPAEGDAANN
ncbi:MAG TPA: helix-turn-helix domain-containing protein [Erythrobacter sp.]|nr:helix-turn-helix domain-containing protein [Erythrobacter sp.]